MIEVGTATEPVAAANGRRIEWANALRGFAALGVVIHHFAFAYFVVPGIVAYDTGMPVQAIVAPRLSRILGGLSFDFGAFGVCLFFLLSGFVISKSLQRYSRRGFVVGRAMRLLPTYAAGTLFLALMVWFNQIREGGSTSLTIGGVALGAVPGLNDLTGTGGAVSNGVVWTLIVEIVFYTACVVFFRRLTDTRWAPLLVGVICLTLGTLIRVLGWDTSVTAPVLQGVVQLAFLAVPFIPILLIGVLLANPRKGGFDWAGALLIVFLYSCFAYMVQYSALYYNDMDYRVRLTYGLTIGLFVLIMAVGQKWGGNPATSFLADISYPLYVLHMLLGWAAINYAIRLGLNVYVALALALVVVIVAAWVLHVAVEVPTHRVGKRWARRITESDEGAVRQDAAAVVPQDLGSSSR